MVNVRFQAGDYEMCVAADGCFAGGAVLRMRSARDGAESGLAEGREGGATNAILAPRMRAVKPMLRAGRGETEELGRGAAQRLAAVTFAGAGVILNCLLSARPCCW